MFSNVPNLAIVFGYLNASWTLRADNNADYVCRLLNRWPTSGAEWSCRTCPTITASTRSSHPVLLGLPAARPPADPAKSAATLPWRLNQDYLEDCRDFRKRPVDDGVLRFA